MEIILKKDVEGVGFKDDIITVKNGFGRNFLIPNGSAILATPSAKKVLAENLKQQAVKDKKIIDDANKIDKNVLIKLRGLDKESLTEKAMKECADKKKEGCYVHYSSQVAFGQ